MADGALLASFNDLAMPGSNWYDKLKNSTNLDMTQFFETPVSANVAVSGSTRKRDEQLRRGRRHLQRRPGANFFSFVTDGEAN